MIGKIIRKFRKDKKMTMKDVSKKSKVTVVHISHVERGITNPSLRTLENIAKGLGTNVAVLFMLSIDRDDVSDKERYDFVMPQIKELILSLK